MHMSDPYGYDQGHEDGLREGRSQANAQWRSKLESAEARIKELERLNADLAVAPRPDCERNLQRAVQDLGALEKIRAHPALHWHLTDIEGARDAAESPEAREICELTLALLQPGEVSRGE